MKANVGGIDKILRIAAGIVVIAVGLYFKSWWGAVGLIPLLTGLINWCPLYVPFKWSTKKVNN
jgi:sulfite exporter TauE/SafE